MKKDQVVYIGNDHGGYALKGVLVEQLAAWGVKCVDVGSNSATIARYPYYAVQVCQAVVEGRADRGILICSTGIGMSIVANRIKGIRAALCTDTYMAKMTRKHNDANVLCLGGKVIGEFEALDILETWLREEYEGGRHDISLRLIEESERSLCRDAVPAFDAIFSGEEE